MENVHRTGQDTISNSLFKMKVIISLKFIAAH